VVRRLWEAAFFGKARNRRFAMTLFVTANASRSMPNTSGTVAATPTDNAGTMISDGRASLPSLPRQYRRRRGASGLRLPALPGAAALCRDRPDLPAQAAMRAYAGRRDHAACPDHQPDFILRGYRPKTTGSSTAPARSRPGTFPSMPQRCWSGPRVAYVHVRSARNNCYQCRIDDNEKKPAGNTGRLQLRYVMWLQATFSRLSGA
jgi:hypothetical protein